MAKIHRIGRGNLQAESPSPIFSLMVKKMVSHGQNHDFHGKKKQKIPPHPQDLPRALRRAMPGSAAPGAPKAHLRSENAGRSGWLFGGQETAGLEGETWGFHPRKLTLTMKTVI